MNAARTIGLLLGHRWRRRGGLVKVLALALGRLYPVLLSNSLGILLTRPFLGGLRFRAATGFTDAVRLPAVER